MGLQMGCHLRKPSSKSNRRLQIPHPLCMCSEPATRSAENIRPQSAPSGCDLYVCLIVQCLVNITGIKDFWSLTEAVHTTTPIGVASNLGCWISCSLPQHMAVVQGVAAKCGKEQPSREPHPLLSSSSPSIYCSLLPIHGSLYDASLHQHT